MSDAPDAAPAVVIPPGPPLEEAAAWVGHACWAELQLHELLTGWLAVEPDAEWTLALWADRAAAAERAEEWHRRLPELREFPRSGFVVPSHPSLPGLFEELGRLDDPAATADRQGALAAVLRGLRLGYHRHQSTAVGPADGPVAHTLQAALRSTFDDLDDDPSPRWSAAIEAAGGLP